MPTLFQTKVTKFIPRLMKDVNADLETACAIFGNLGHESNGFQTMQEIGQKPPKGGWGWAQWTGPRRRQFEAWADGKKLDRASDEANYGFLINELLGTEKAALAATKKAVGLNDKTDMFEAKFERAGVPALVSRRKYAKIAYDAMRKVPQVSDQPVIPDTPPPVMPKPVPAAPEAPVAPAPSNAAAGAVAGGGGLLAILAGALGNWWWVALGIVAVALVAGIILIKRK